MKNSLHRLTVDLQPAEVTSLQARCAEIESLTGRGRTEGRKPLHPQQVMRVLARYLIVDDTLLRKVATGVRAGMDAVGDPELAEPGR